MFQRQMMGQLMLITSPILGAIADKFSSKVLMYTIAVTGILGLSILAISIATHIDELLFVAFICLGIMSVGSSVMTVQTGMVFKGRMRTRYGIHGSHNCVLRFHIKEMRCIRS